MCKLASLLQKSPVWPVFVWKYHLERLGSGDGLKGRLESLRSLKENTADSAEAKSKGVKRCRRLLVQHFCVHFTLWDRAPLLCAPRTTEAPVQVPLPHNTMEEETSDSTTLTKSQKRLTLTSCLLWWSLSSFTCKTHPFAWFLACVLRSRPLTPFPTEISVDLESGQYYEHKENVCSLHLCICHRALFFCVCEAIALQTTSYIESGCPFVSCRTFFWYRKHHISIFAS